MDKDRVKGKIDEVVGGAKRHFGSVTGNKETEVKGAIQQVKGKIEDVAGKVKDAVRDSNSHVAASNETYEKAERERREAVVAEDRSPL